MSVYGKFRLIRIRMTVHQKIWPTVYIRRMYGLNCIWTVYEPYLQVVHPET